MNACFLLLVVVILAVVPSASSYDKDQIPGKIITWHFNGSKKHDKSVETQTIEVPKAYLNLESNVKNSKNLEVVALLKFENSPSVDKLYAAPELADASARNIQSSVYLTKGSRDSKSPIFEHVSQSSLFHNAKEMTATEFRSHLNAASNSHPLSNGRVDSYVISVQHNDADLAVLNEISRMGTRSASLSFVAAQEPSAQAYLPSKNSNYNRILSTDTIDGAAYSPEGAEYSIFYHAQYLYLTPDIFTGLMTMLFVAFVVLVGLSCMGSIQGSTAFAAKMPVIGREA